MFAARIHVGCAGFVGATGDLAHKKVVPALHAMARRGHLNVPVVGVAKSGWDLNNLRARARDSIGANASRSIQKTGIDLKKLRQTCNRTPSPSTNRGKTYCVQSRLVANSCGPFPDLSDM
jgi:glucose-6-phosphate 1-dehydrogenase